MERTLKGPIKARLIELNTLIRISRKHLAEQIMRVGNVLLKPTDLERGRLLDTFQELRALEAEHKLLRKELKTLPSRARHYAKD